MDMLRATCKVGGIFCAVAFLVLLVHAPAYPRVVTTEGTTQPVLDGEWPAASKGWPKGTVDLANLPSRTRLFGVHGQADFCFEYQGDTATFNEALKTFAEIRAPKLELVVHDGMAPVKSDEFGGGSVDWTFTVWNARIHHVRHSTPDPTGGTMIPLFLPIGEGVHGPQFLRPVRSTTVPPPRIDVYLFAGGGIVWDDVIMPAGGDIAVRRAPGKPTEGGTLACDVYDMATAKPVAGASVYVFSGADKEKPKWLTEGKTDIDGTCMLDRIPEGTYHVHVGAETYVTRDTGDYDNRQGTAYEKRIVYLAKNVEVSGSVIDPSGQPVAGARVYAHMATSIDGELYSPARETEPVETDGAGRFRFIGLPQGYIYLQCLGRWYSSTAFEPFPAPARDIRIMAVRTGAVHGTLVDSAGMPPATFPRPDSPDKTSNQVCIARRGDFVGRRRGSTATVSPDGKFEWNNLPPGEYYVGTDPWSMEYGPSHDGTTHPVFVKSGEVTEVEFRLPPAAKTGGSPPIPREP